MNRPICVLAIILIIIIVGLHNLGVVLFDYDKVYSLDGLDKSYEGIILNVKKETDYKITYNIKIISDDIFNEKKFLLDVKKKDYDKLLEYGDMVCLNGIYNKPNEKGNYGGFDYSLYLKTQKIYGIIDATNISLISKNNISYLQKSLNSLKEYTRKVLNKNLGEDEANLCIGLLIGDRTELSDDIEEDFKTSNLTHLLAVSGSHFVYIVIGLQWLNKFLKRKRLGQLLMIIVIILFMNLTGNTGSVVRSGLMAILTVLSSVFYRKSDIMNSMAISIIIQIILNPYIIFDIGTQLSYGGVIGIVLFNKEIVDFMGKISGLIMEKLSLSGTNNTKIKLNFFTRIIEYIIDSISVTISANLVIIPIMMFNFNTISFSFIISNLLAGAILGVIVIYGFVLVFLSIILGNFLIPFFYILNIMLKILLSIAHFCSKIPFSKVYLITPSIFFIMAYYICLYIIKLKKYKFKFIGSITLLLILFNFIFQITISKSNNLELNFIDVGQGDCTLIRVSNKAILIDGGGSSYSDSYDVGEMTVVPYLLDRGIYKLDYVIVSHFDSDHCQGLSFVMENLTVENVIVSPLGQESNEYTEFINLAQKQKSNIIYVKKGDLIKLGSATIKILFPDEILIPDNEKNNNALVFKLNYKNISILFTGDIEEKAEKKILDLYQSNLKELECTILKVAHHGSKTSSIQTFLDIVKPKIALIGVGEDNNFGHPNEGVIQRLNDIGCKIYRTDKNGEITAKINKHGDIDIECELKH